MNGCSLEDDGGPEQDESSSTNSASTEAWTVGDTNSDKKGTEPFKELPGTQEADRRQAVRQAESSAGGQDQETDQRRSKKPKIPLTEKLQEGLQSDLGEQWTGRTRV